MSTDPRRRGIELVYLGSPYPPGSRGHYSLPGLVPGQRYEVAEILELQGHVMARQPGAREWPAPFHERFGVHPEWFEPVDEPIPIFSCGYEYNDTLCDFFGVILDEPDHVEIVRGLKRLDFPDEDESFDQWKAREAADLPDAAARGLFTWLHDYPYDLGWVADAVVADPPLRAPFAYMGAYGDSMFRNDVRHAELQDCIDRVLAGLGIEGAQVGVHHQSYWRGSGQPRLINPSSRERYLYGIRYEHEHDSG